MKVFWSRCGHGHGNFGDKLTPLFLDYFNLRYQWAPPEEADLLGVGSLMEKVPNEFRGVIWTSGCMFSATRKSLTEAEVLAFRGQLTHDRVRCKEADVVLGDGGLLCDLFFKPATRKFKLGLIPHFADQKDRIVSLLASTDPEITVIDICAPTLEVIERVGECEYILSSSLHGLILADSLGVPNHWMELGPATVLGGGFKFQDYYSIYGLEKVRPIYLGGVEAVSSILSRCAPYHRPGISERKAALMKSLERLVKRFGGDPGQRSSLATLRERQGRAVVDQEAWNSEVRSSLQLLEQFVPRGSRFVLVDDEQFRSEVTHALALPLIERDGQYWGAPADDEQAVAELKRHVQCGIEYIGFAENCFWWLESYSRFAEFLRANFESICTTPKLRLLKARTNLLRS